MRDQVRHLEPAADGQCTFCHRRPAVNHRDLDDWLCLGWLCDIHDCIAVSQRARAHAEYAL